MSINELLREDRFFRSLFRAIPCGVMVVDSDRRVQAVNAIMERTFGLQEAEIHQARGGQALRCLIAVGGENICGQTPFCREHCEILRAAEDALSGKEIRRRRAEIRLSHQGAVKDLIILVSAAPIDYAGQRMAIVMIEDVSELSRLRRRIRGEADRDGIVGRNRQMLELHNAIDELARVNAPVLLQGESGTGKELAARAIHRRSGRVDRLFVPVNCGALPEGLIESELFGHVEGAFTGAVRDKKGRFELADGGTLFLDEVTALKPALQVKLLRALQDGAFEPVGGEETRHADVRIVSATNDDIWQEIRAGRFRQDLFYRLCVIPVILPPLRKRRDDIPLLAEHFMADILADSTRQQPRLAPETLDTLMRYDWPGNVRELRNAIEHALVKSRGALLLPEHLPPVLVAAVNRVQGDIRQSRRHKLTAAAVEEALHATHGNKMAAARVLGVSRATLYRFLGVHLSNPRSEA